MKLPGANSSAREAGLAKPSASIPLAFPHSTCSQIADMLSVFLMVLPEKVFQQSGRAVPVPRELQPEVPLRNAPSQPCADAGQQRSPRHCPGKLPEGQKTRLKPQGNEALQENLILWTQQIRKSQIFLPTLSALGPNFPPTNAEPLSILPSHSPFPWHLSCCSPLCPELPYSVPPFSPTSVQLSLETFHPAAPFQSCSPLGEELWG